MPIHVANGSPVRAACTAPARYLDHGYCLYVSAMCNDLGMDIAIEPMTPTQKTVLPSDGAVEAATLVLRWAMSREASRGGDHA